MDYALINVMVIFINYKFKSYIFKSRQKRFNVKIFRNYTFKTFFVECIDNSFFGKPLFAFYQPSKAWLRNYPDCPDPKVNRVVKFTVGIAGMQDLLQKILGWKTGMQRVVTCVTPKGYDIFSPSYQLGASIHNPKDKFDAYIGNCEALDCLFRIKKAKAKVE